MANFVERATLEVIDKSSGKINKINSSISQLMRTVRGFRGKQLDIGVKGNPAAELKKVTSELSKLRRSARTPITVRTQTQTLPARPGPPVGAGVGFQPPRNTQRGFASAFPPPEGYGRSMGQAFLRSVQFRLANAIENAIINGFSKGVKDQDVADTKIDLQGISNEDQSSVSSIVSRLGSQFQSFTTGQITDAAAELLATTRGDTSSLEPTLAGLLRFSRTQVALGKERSSAIDDAFLIAKAAEQSGNFTDNQGNFSAENFNKFLAVASKAQIAAGKEIDARAIISAIKNLGATRFGLNDKAIFQTLLRFEEQGTRASTSLERFARQVSGIRITKKGLNELVRLGLATTKEVQSGTTGGKTKTTTVVDQIKNAETLFTSPLDFVRETLIPALEKDGADLSNIADLQLRLGRLFTDSNAARGAFELITRLEELDKAFDAAGNFKTSEQELANIASNSSVVAFSRVSAQFENALGQLANSLETILIPAANGVADVFNSIANIFSGNSGPDDPANVVRAGSVVAGTGGAAALLGKKLFDMRPMNQAAAQHMTAARMLQSAAARLGGGSVVGGDRPGNGNQRRTGGTSKIGIAATALAIPAIAEAAKEAGQFLGDKLSTFFLGRTDKEQSEVRESSEESNRRNARIMTEALKSLFRGDRPDNPANEFETSTPSDTQAIKESVKAEALSEIKSLMDRALQISQQGVTNPLLQEQVQNRISEARQIAADVGLNNDELSALNAQASNIQQAFGITTQQAEQVAGRIETAPPQLESSIVSGAQQGSEIIKSGIIAALQTPVNVKVAQNQVTNRPPNTGSSELTGD